jgi:hypothetical protein
MNKTNMATPSMGFTPEDIKNISNVLGYTGEPSGFADYLSKNPQAHDSFMGIQKQRLQFDNGGFVATQHMANGGLNQKQEDYIKRHTGPDGYYREPARFLPYPAPPLDPDFDYNTLLPTLEARGLIDTRGPFIREGDYDKFGNPTEYTYEQSKQLNFRDDPVLNDFLNAGYFGGTPFFNESTGQYIPSITLSDGRTLTREQFNRMRSGGPFEEKYFPMPDVYNTGNTTTNLPKGNYPQIGPGFARRETYPENTDYPPLSQLAPPTKDQVDLSQIQAPQIGVETAQRLQQPALPAGGVYTAAQTPTEAAQSVAPSTALITGDVRIAEAGQAQAAQSIAPTATTAAAITAAQAAPDVRDVAAQTTAAQLAAPTQTIQAAQQTETAVGQIPAAQTAGVQIQPVAARQLQAGEVIAAPTGQAAQAAQFVQPTAAVAEPSKQATVQGQLESLISQFTDKEVPLWARGAVDNARAVLQQRGIGASSMAGQAIVEAAMRAALPIAQVDAATVAGFEQANLSNRQQAAMVSAQYRAQFMQQEFDQGFQTRVQNAARVADIANLNFTSEQQVALENARLAQTTDLNNLSNRQALVMANAAQIAGLETANLNNRQQTAVQNAQNFLQVDMANLGNSQQTALFNAQNRIQSILSDVAAENAARQFNAANEQQLDQFFANLGTQVSQQNSAQQNAINQFNAGEINTLQRFNSEIVNQRDQFNAQNQLAIAQSNAQWRREIATTDTAAINFQNQLNAQNLLEISNTAYNNLWQEYRDTIEWAWSSSENEYERLAAMTVAQINAKARQDLAEYTENKKSIGSIGGFVADLFKAGLTTKVTGWF